MDIPVDKKIIDKLKKIPEFICVYELDALKPYEFFILGVPQKILSQFMETGWAPLETYGAKTVSARWT